MKVNHRVSFKSPEIQETPKRKGSDAITDKLIAVLIASSVGGNKVFLVINRSDFPPLAYLTGVHAYASFCVTTSMTDAPDMSGHKCARDESPVKGFDVVCCELSNLQEHNGRGGDGFWFCSIHGTCLGEEQSQPTHVQQRYSQVSVYRIGPTS